ncbi:magnesium transporter MgtE N-terminal domain-containing protein [Phytohabitans houttuyneae]|uniref:Magnesium transporter MgtE intracellular domain-containing protein n=1 Tax=Phytohabitans houttuyneae TaxID=1076126 RepID=A0A6V8JV50_9ACTN|nr:hypothetical protein [Phytohabitans houttuyneae]GFJ76482.1 hypothetical protein Phou_006620 [Phytohabitans houttuyneae]
MKHWSGIDPTADSATSAERLGMTMELILQILDSLGTDVERQVYLSHVGFGVPLATLRIPTGRPLTELRRIVRTADASSDRLLRRLVEEVGILSVSSSPDLEKLARRLGALTAIACRTCGGPVRPMPRGRPPIYCSDRCRQIAHRRRRADPRQARERLGVTVTVAVDDLSGLTEAEVVRLLSEIPGSRAADLLLRLPSHLHVRVLNRLARPRLLALLRELPAERAAALLPGLSLATVTGFLTAADPAVAARVLSRLDASQAALLLASTRLNETVPIVAALPRRLAGELLPLLSQPNAVVSAMVPDRTEIGSDLLFHVSEAVAVQLITTVRRNIGGALLDAMSSRRAATLLSRVMDATENDETVLVWVAGRLLEWMDPAKAVRALHAMPPRRAAVLLEATDRDSTVRRMARR